MGLFSYLCCNQYINQLHTCRTTAAPQVPASPIFSLQMDPLPDQIALVKDPITITFNVVRHYMQLAIWDCSIYVIAGTFFFSS